MLFKPLNFANRRLKKIHRSIPFYTHKSIIFSIFFRVVERPRELGSWIITKTITRKDFMHPKSSMNITTEFSSKNGVRTTKIYVKQTNI